MPSAKSNKTEPAKKMKVAANSEKTIGRWAYKGAGSHELEIIMIKNRYFSRYKYEGQPSFNRGLIRKGGPNGKKYEDLESDEGAYYVVTSSGGLTAYDNARFIRTLKKKR